MFFPEKIKSILPSYKVLEIGPGSQPHPRANVFLEKNFSQEEAIIQSGYVNPVHITDKPVFYYDGGKFPFKDNEFDYVICSHVLEHIPVQDLPLFLSEIQRVSSRGYLEFPTVFYELINYQVVLIWLMNYRN